MLSNTQENWGHLQNFLLTHALITENNLQKQNIRANVFQRDSFFFTSHLKANYNFLSKQTQKAFSAYLISSLPLICWSDVIRAQLLVCCKWFPLLRFHPVISTPNRITLTGIQNFFLCYLSHQLIPRTPWENEAWPQRHLNIHGGVVSLKSVCLQSLRFSSVHPGK